MLARVQTVLRPAFPGAQLLSSVSECQYAVELRELALKGNRKLALSIVQRMEREGPPPQAEHYTAAIHACENEHFNRYRARRPRDFEACGASELLQRARDRGVADTTTHTRAMYGATRCGHPGMALEVLEQAFEATGAERVLRDAASVQPCATLYRAGLHACMIGKQWERAMELLAHMKDEHGIQPTGDHYSLVMTACNHGQRPQMVLQLLSEMRRHGITVEAKHYNIAISSAFKAPANKAARDVLRLLEEARRDGLVQPAWAYSLGIMALSDAKRLDEALQLLEQMREDGVVARPARDGSAPKHVRSHYQKLLRACGTSVTKRGTNAIEVLEMMQAESPPVPHTRTIITEAMRACRVAGADRSDTVAGSLALFNEKRQAAAGRLAEITALHQATVPPADAEADEQACVPDIFMFHEAIRACGSLGRVDEALALLRDLQRMGGPFAPTTSTYNVTISACAHNDHWDSATELLHEMQAGGVAPNGHTFGLAIRACGKPGEWQRALSLHDRMLELEIAPSDATYKSLIEVLDRAGQLDEADRLYRTARRSGFFQHVWAPKPGYVDEHAELRAAVETARGRWFAMDFHNTTAAVSRAIVRNYVADLRAGVEEPATVLVLTGTGVRNPPNKPPVLIHLVPKEFAEHSHGALDLSPFHAAGGGHFLLQRASVETWLETALDASQSPPGPAG